MSIWIVDIWNEDRRRWEPTVGVALNREDGRIVLSKWRSANSGCKFQLSRYVKP